jgi:hypothetical protein
LIKKWTSTVIVSKSPEITDAFQENTDLIRMSYHLRYLRTYIAHV